MFLRWIEKSTAIASAGFVITAISFGPARMGFGLFLPIFREEFSISTLLAGQIASLGFLGFLLGLPLSGALGKRFGQRVPIMLGALSATFGFLTVVQAQSFSVLALGVALATASAGFCWSPFNNITEYVVPDYKQANTLSAVSTGTTLGVTLTGALFLGVTFDYFTWRFAWEAFFLMSILACMLVGVCVPKSCAYRRSYSSSIAIFFGPKVVPLYIAAISFGICNAVYLSFAADYVVQKGGLVGIPDQGAAAVIYLSYGIFGVAGLKAGEIEAKTGIPLLLAITFFTFAISLVLLALMPSTWFGLIMSAALHGIAVMMISATLSFWSLRLFPGRGSQGFRVALYGVALGNLVGPALLGWLANTTDLTTALLIASAIPLAATGMFVTFMWRGRA